MKSVMIYGLQILLGLLFLVVGGAKLAGADMMVHQFHSIGLGDFSRLVAGSIEIIGGLALFVPRTAAYGAVMLACLAMAATGMLIGRAATAQIGPQQLQQQRATIHNAVLKTTVRHGVAAAPAFRRTDSGAYSI